MTFCPNCGIKVRVKGANKRKKKGIWIHKNCQLRKPKVSKAKLNLGKEVSITINIWDILKGNLKKPNPSAGPASIRVSKIKPVKKGSFVQ